jgi:hypothetical protein
MTATRVRLNGWQRLWIVLGALWLIAVVVIAHGQWPIEPPPSFWESPDLVREIEPNVLRALRPPTPQETAERVAWYAAHPPENGQRVVRSEDFVDTGQYDRAKALIQPRLALAIRERQRLFIGEAIAAWVAPIGGLYLLGWAIAWVRRGFSTTE